MNTVIGVLRRLPPAPTADDITFARRGFPVAANAVSRRVEEVPRAVVEGFGYGADHVDPAAIARRLDWVDPEWRSLAYEGAVGALIVRDLLRGRKSHRAVEFVRGPGAPHAMMAYVGCGLVLSRLPRTLWRRAVPVFDSDPLLPWLRWLAVDGYGFDKAYFDPARWVFGTAVPRPYPFDGAPEHFGPVFDQGVGRALWFVFGGNAEPLPRTIAAFAPSRRADLWSGIGAAITYVGGPDAADLERLLDAARGYRPELAVGAVSAAKARVYAGHVPETARVGVELLCGTTVEKAAQIADEAAEVPPDPGPPPYVQWRRRVAARFAEAGR
ncbi:MAG TPA: DUF1702 family protein [Aldersonia sp.]